MNGILKITQIENTNMKPEIKIQGINRKDEESEMNKKLEPVRELMRILVGELTRSGYIVRGRIRYKPLEWSPDMGFIGGGDKAP